MSASDMPLARNLPLLVGRLGPLRLADLPTPVARLDGLGDCLGRDDLYIKRDDLSSPLYGGNKVRKLEFLLGEARRKGVTHLLTMGGLGSNHLLATALHGNSLGLRTVGVVFPQPVNAGVRRNMAADRGVGVELVPIRSKYLLPVSVAKTLARVTIREGRAPLLIPGGGSSPLGALGFVNAGFELAEQVRRGELPEPAAVFLPYGTGGTAAGLALGLQLAGLTTRVLAVRVIDRLLANRPRMLFFMRALTRFVAGAGDTLDLGGAPADNLKIIPGYIGRGYGHRTRAAERAVELFGRREGIKLEFTYTGKAAAALLDFAAWMRGPLLFWNTYSSANIDSWVAAGSRQTGKE
ncbi:MAG TPA: pyridoxal-phosphate dependent enzyme [Myxococcota bacterium]|nr:pyridoxal-phosphate dependent enzyme [Myxococcota bacterium]